MWSEPSQNHTLSQFMIVASDVKKFPVAFVMLPCQKVILFADTNPDFHLDTFLLSMVLFNTECYCKVPYPKTFFRLATIKTSFA